MRSSKQNGAKSRIQVTVDPYTLQRFDQRVENRSGRIEDFMKRIAEIEEGKDQDLVKRKEEIKEKVAQNTDKIEKLKSENSTLESELKAIESALEQEESQVNKLKKAVDALSEEWISLRRKTRDADKATKRLKSKEQFHVWLDQLEFDEEGLMDEVKKEVQES